MKLSRITKPPRSVQARVTLAGEVNAALENYARYPGPASRPPSAPSFVRSSSAARLLSCSIPNASMFRSFTGPRGVT
jgi:hypothetical protein